MISEKVGGKTVTQIAFHVTRNSDKLGEMLVKALQENFVDSFHINMSKLGCRGSVSGTDPVDSKPEVMKLLAAANIKFTTFKQWKGDAAWSLKDQYGIKWKGKSSNDWECREKRKSSHEPRV